MTLENTREKRECKKKVHRIRDAIVLALLLLLSAMAIGTKHKQVKPESSKVPVTVSKIVIPQTKRHIKMSTYFKKRGNKHPDAMATAVLETKRPKLMAAIAVKGELNTPYTVKHGGYKNRYVGAWQVCESEWGRAGNLPIDQALKSERILETLVAESKGDLKKALNLYGGDKTKKVYAKNILNELNNIP